MKSKNSVFIKYTMFFYLVFFIPLLIAGIFITEHTRRLLREKNLTEQERYITILSDGLNREFNHIFECADRLSLSTTIARFSLSYHNPYNITPRNELAANALSCELISDIYLVTTNDETPYAISSTTTYPLASFSGMISEGAMNETEYLVFLDGLNLSTDDSLPYIDYQKDRILLYFKGPSKAVENHSGYWQLLMYDIYLIFELDKASFNRYLASLSAPAELLYTFVAETEILYRNYPPDGEYAQLESAYRDPAGKQAVKENDRFRIDSGTGLYTAYADIAALPGWYCGFMISEDNISKQILASQTGVFWMILLVSLLGNMMVLVFTYASYLPVKQLKRSMETMITAGSPAGKSAASCPAASGDEFQVIEQIARSLHRSNHELSALSSMDKADLKQFILLNLIQGKVADFNEIKISLNRIGLFLEHNYLLVAVLYPDLDLTGLLTYDAFDTYAAFLEGYGEMKDKTIYAVHGMENRELILVVSVYDDDMEPHRLFWEELQADFGARFGSQVLIGVGQIYPELNQLSVSYRQAVMAGESRRLHDDSPILYYSLHDDIRSLDDRYQNMLDYLEKAVADLSMPKAESALYYFLDQAAAGNPSLQNIRHICNSIVQVLSAAFYLLPFRIDEEFPGYSYLERTSMIETEADYRDLITDIKAETARLIGMYLTAFDQKPLPADGSNTVRTKIIPFIEQNIRSNQLSLLLIAAEFGFSTDHVSRIFKAEIKMTVLEYINRQRIELAKQLLASSDAPVEDIVTKIGYQNTSSFIRKFKKTAGMTPGEYRKRGRSN